jgi:hypothetical protein
VQRVFDRDAFDRAVGEFRFDEAERLLEAAEPARQDELRELARQGQARALAAARELYQRIVDRGSLDDHAAVLAIDLDSSTRSLLGLLSESDRRRAEIYLGAAARWAAARKKKNERRLDEARRALDEFDLELARGLIALIEEPFLDEPAVATRDGLLLDIEARSREMKSLRETERRLTGPSPTERPPWWRRRRR